MTTTIETQQPVKQSQNIQDNATEEKEGLFQLQSESAFDFEDNRPESFEQFQLQAIADNSPQIEYALQLQGIADQQMLNQEDQNTSKYFATGLHSTSFQSEPTFEFEDNRPETIQQIQLQGIIHNSPQVDYAIQLQKITNNQLENDQKTVQKKNNTGLPDDLKAGVENLSGISMDDVKVHYNSDKPAQLQAHAYAQGTDIHVASGQEKHLAHEAWHVVQQKQGRVKPTIQRKGIAINDDATLEKEADEMGAKALQMKSNATNTPNVVTSSSTTTQRIIGDILDRFSPRAFISDQLQNSAWYNFACSLVGKDLITDEAVPNQTIDTVRAGANIFGESYLQRLEENGGIEELVVWIEEQKALLPNGATLKLKINQGIDTLTPDDILQPVKAITDFLAPIQPEIDKFTAFANNIGIKILEAVKNALRQKAKELAEENQKIYPLITVILGKDPISGDAVPRTADNFIRGFLNLVEGGEQRYIELKESGAIEDAMNWLNNEIVTLDLTWEGIQSLFQQAWDSIGIEDLADPIGAFQDIIAIFTEPAQRVIQFAVNVGKKVFEFIFKGAMRLVGGDEILAILEKGKATFDTIVNDPIGFLNNLLDAVGQGFGQFRDNFLQHLQVGLIDWLTGTLTDAGITLPEQWDLKGILSLVLQIADITYDSIRERLVNELDEETVAKIETTVDFVKDLVVKGPMMIWEKITEFVGDIKTMVFDGIKEWVKTSVVGKAIQELIAFFAPAGAIIKAVQGIYRTVNYFIEKIEEITAVVNSMIDSIANIAAGSIGDAANSIETTLAQTIDPAISFLTRIIGLGDIGAQIANVIQGFRDEYIYPALDKAVKWIVSTGIKVGNAVKRFIGKVINFTVGDEEHKLWVEVNGEAVDVMVASESMPVDKQLNVWKQELKENNSTEKEKISQLIEETLTLYSFTKVQGQKASEDSSHNDKVKISQEKLKEKLKVLFEFFEKETASENSVKIPDFSGNPRAFTAILDRSVLDTGSAPSDANNGVEGWQEIRDAGLTQKGENWCRMHLLAAKLGGKAEDGNLMPARGTLNSEMDKEIEAKAYKEVKENNTTIWFKVEIDTFKDVITPKGENKEYLSKIIAKWGIYSEQNGYLKEENILTRYPLRPHFTEGKNTVFMNDKPGETNLARALGFKKSNAQVKKIVDFLKSREPYVTRVGYLLEKMEEANISLKDDTKNKLEDAVANGKISFATK